MAPSLPIRRPILTRAAKRRMTSSPHQVMTRRLMKASHPRCPGCVIKRQLDATQTSRPFASVGSKRGLHAPLPVTGAHSKACRETQPEQAGADIDEVEGTHAIDSRTMCACLHAEFSLIFLTTTLVLRPCLPLHCMQVRRRAARIRRRSMLRRDRRRSF